jgi:DNA polymerase-4
MIHHDFYRKIIHVDMDAFFASVEQLDNINLIGKPVAVGGGGERGVVAAASYEARKFGVRSAMNSNLAKKKCPQLIFVKPRFERYKEISLKIRAIFFQYTDLVEPLSLDEAYLDVTDNKVDCPSATILAREIRQRIFDKVGLRASAGISVNKFVAKIASDINKPNGQKTIPPEEVMAFLEKLPIEKFYGIGKVTTAKMYNLGIFTGNDLKRKSKDFLILNFNKSGGYYYNIVRGNQSESVKPNRIRKSVAAEHTFNKNLTSEVYLVEKIEQIAIELEQRLNKAKISGKTITLKIKYSDFKTQTRSKTLAFFINEKKALLKYATQLLYQEQLSNSVRLIGISLSNLNILSKIEVPKFEVQLKLEF